VHHGLTKTLYDAYSPRQKSDFSPAYLYLKYIDHFLRHALEAAGLPAREFRDELDENIDELLRHYVRQIGDALPSAEANSYHGKVVKLRDAIKLVTQKQNCNLSPPERALPCRVARDLVLRINDPIAVGGRSVALTCMPPTRAISR